jgi:uncharacterized protein YjbJ (UPF0337 family)
MLDQSMSAVARRLPTEEDDMANQNRTEHTIKEMGAKVKKGFGEATGNERMEAEGRAEELEHRAKKDAAKAKENIKGQGEELYGKAKKNVGDFIDDERMEAEGRATELKGEARQKLNKPS